MSRSAKVRSLGGIVIDGGIRDISELAEVGFPVFARSVIPEGTVKVTPGSINCPVICGGVVASPGDVVIGDENGVVAIPQDRFCSFHFPFDRGSNQRFERTDTTPLSFRSPFLCPDRKP